MEIKNSLTMPKTGFEMRGNLAQKEPKILERWNNLDLYNKMLHKNENHQTFILHDGPPYANGDIHAGHALNKALKDFIIRYKLMSGFYAPYIPGWDTHGLPIENALAKKGINRKNMPMYDFREKCREYALQQVERQKTGFLRLGSIGDYDHPYITLLKEFEGKQIEIFSKMALDGLIYKGLKPVYWSPSSESALAEAEIEYHDVKSTSIYVAFKVKDTKGVLEGDESFVIWTTTPWTIPANLAICLNSEYEYGVFETSNRGKLIFLKEFVETLTAELSLEDVKLVKTFKGSELEGIVTSHPLYGRDSVIILGDHVTNESGTGCVHTAPGHGADDFIVGCKYGLEAYCPVNEKGVLMEEAGPRLAGLFYEAANEEVLKWLDEVGALLRANTIVHSYPHDWRTKKPIIFRATAQWFCSISPIREKILEEIKNVTWYPEWGEVRLHNMISDRADWCISRQRAWGVPIPIIYNEDDTPIMDKEVFAHITKLIRENGSNIWYKLSEKELLPEGYTNSHSPNGNFRKETDIMDVWFDSGSSHTAVLEPRGIDYPADLYLEGSDQYRGWFNSSLIIGVAYHGKSPYRTVVSHGFILDGKGQKMSKSLGNVIDPMKVMNQYGADILRLWDATVAYQSDVSISEQLLKQVSETYRKVRNTIRFLLGNLSDFGGKTFNYELNHQEKLEKVDLYVLEKLKKVVNTYISSFDKYDFATAVQELLNFMTNDLSSFYLDLTKDILYCEDSNSVRRRQVQTVIYTVLDHLIRMFAPILPYTMEEAFDFFKGENAPESVHLLDMVKKYENIDNELLNEYALILKLRSDVLKSLEESRAEAAIGSAQEASVKLEILNPQIKEIFASLPKIEQTRLFIVSSVEEVENLDAKEYEVSKVLVSKHTGERCERCWNRFEAHELDENHLCSRCHDVYEALKDE